MQSEAKGGDHYSTASVFNNNTLGEMVIKLNSMLRSLHRPDESVLLNLDGLTEPQIKSVLERRVINWPAKGGLTFGGIVEQVAQYTNCTIDRKEHDLVLTPQATFGLWIYDVLHDGLGANGKSARW